MIAFVVPVRTTNPLNGSQGRTRGAMIAEAKRRKDQRNVAKLCTLAATGGKWFRGAQRIVVLKRLSAGTLDGDGCQAALKSVRDGIADALGFNDGDSGVKWDYRQEKCPRGLYGVMVFVT